MNKLSSMLKTLQYCEARSVIRSLLNGNDTLVFTTQQYIERWTRDVAKGIFGIMNYTVARRQLEDTSHRVKEIALDLWSYEWKA